MRPFYFSDLREAIFIKLAGLFNELADEQFNNLFWVAKFCPLAK